MYRYDIARSFHKACFRMYIKDGFFARVESQFQHMVRLIIDFLLSFIKERMPQIRKFMKTEKLTGKENAGSKRGRALRTCILGLPIFAHLPGFFTIISLGEYSLALHINIDSHPNVPVSHIDGINCKLRFFDC